MNSIFRTLSRLSVEPEKKKKYENKWPTTYAFNKKGECIGTLLGRAATFLDFPEAFVLNVQHRNGRVTVIKK